MLERVMVVGGTGGGDRVAAGALDVEASDDGHVKMTREVLMKHEVMMISACNMKHEALIIPECSMEHAVFMKHEVLKIPECSMVLKILGAIAYRFSVTPSRTPMLDWGEDWLASSSSRQLNTLSFPCALCTYVSCTIFGSLLVSVLHSLSSSWVLCHLVFRFLRMLSFRCYSRPFLFSMTFSSP